MNKENLLLLQIYLERSTLSKDGTRLQLFRKAVMKSFFFLGYSLGMRPPSIRVSAILVWFHPSFGSKQ